MAGVALDNPAGLDDTTDAYFLPRGDGLFAPTLRTQGAWQPAEQHMAPVAGLLAHVMESHDSRPDLQLSRVTYEILGMIPARPFGIRVRTLRPGRTIELVEATMSTDGQDVVRATGWRLSRQDTSEVAGGFWDPLPCPQDSRPWDGTRVWGGGFIDSLEFRVVRDGRPGRGAAWISTSTPLIHGVDVSPIARFITLVDTANGIATRAHPQEWMFPNTDLTIHLFRHPTPGWVGFDTEVLFGETGVGLTSSKLFDERGAVGRAEQILTVREMPTR
ncbi:thioesterase family protein [Austwickia chelonae]|uniref:Thioesterase n=1 Tax=Austwickia chelonae NBRC 105200 TaxID=1184607 RepID=K6VSW6_9MICO|nr:thioesterase family protein [Austwickia chelonae]GAB78440.1 hypothetical protein AUCHE_09_00460 [Austwickia chelonae NBRC 105200]